MTLTEGKKVYFASDNHLGAPNLEDSLVREKKFVAWLDKAKEDAEAMIFGLSIKKLCLKVLQELLANLLKFLIGALTFTSLLEIMICGLEITSRKN